MDVERERPPHRVAVLVRHGVLPMELGIAHQVLGAARGREGTGLYEVVTCAPRPGRVRTDADFTLYVDHGLEALAWAGTVVVPASHELDESDRPLTPAALEALRSLDPSTRVASICTGAFVLAEAGLLDGCLATTHWMSADRFRRRFPAVRLEPEVLYTEDGRVLTSAGEASGLDLCLHIVRSDHGAAVANDVARRTVVPAHRPGGQAQYVQRPVPAPHSSSTAAARAWALRHLDRPVSLREVADRESMSVRSFTRRFREEMGTSFGQWLTQQRIQRARHLLEATDLTVDRIAEDAGFGTAASLRQHLRSALGVSPSGYRAAFGGAVNGR